MRKMFSQMFTIVVLSGVVSFPYANEQLNGRDARGNRTENYSSQGLNLTISSEKTRFLDKEDIPLMLQISNQGFYPVTIYMHRNYLRNFTLIAREPGGKSLKGKESDFSNDYKDYKDTFQRSFTGTNFHSRKIVLQPGESLQRQIIFQELIDLDDLSDKNSMISIDAYFYINPEQAPDYFIKSMNTFNIYIDSAENRGMSRKNLLAIEKSEISPEEAVFLALTAEFYRDWPSYFKYVSMKDLVRDYPEYARKYMMANRQEKTIVLESLQSYLMERETHKLMKFQVLRENGQSSTERDFRQSRKIANVKVRAVRMVEGFPREFAYTYYLTQNENFWKITGVESQLIQ